ncbi:MAG: hypothetical protein A2977_00580 [Alphaproteobacteria bacterium RIFCSPLOWO2_01_FULL_45_8]|nr:MAG: hypothetical protein A3K20_03990 [Alphaproteobacteria bacterium GWA1_45_9]OFW89639.1 MAG: hypothetical protein A2621_01880 [Alphaproteobacteria bacterium RIFCSPHIGHO2_01_FULL_41_14]OFW96578.1 MAG: hypothetical protein A2977_00580 [Alphaproteobacteria bacterium RIFCSPLOWO2_01_FULL_45_8]HCI49078.1 hypothetical protein [Holosporales bacterium]
MIVSRFFLSLMFILGWIALAPSCSFAASSKVPCRLRNSNYCKNPDIFLRDKKDGCAKPDGNCRRKFCQANCLGATIPEKGSDLYRLCQINCDSGGINFDTEKDSGFSRGERKTFDERFNDRTLRRKREITAAIAKLLSMKIWCEDQCDYDENAPESCQFKGPASDTRWPSCAQQCWFIKDIKEHAEQCAAQSMATPMRPEPAPRRRPPSPPRPRPRPQNVG